MDRRTSIHFSEYLDRLPGGMVFERFVNRCGSGRKIVSASTIRDVSALFSNEKNLLETFLKLSKDAQFAVSLVYLFGDRGLPVEYFHHVIGKSSQKEKKGDSNMMKMGNAVSGFDGELMHSFLVYAAEDAQGKMYYVGFDEFEPKLRNSLARTIVGKIRIPSQKDGPAFPHFICVNDIAAIVGLASQGKLMKTKNGLLNKTSEQYVNRLLHGAHASFDCQPTLMRPWALALWYCLRKKLIFTREEQYVAEHRLMCNWISRSVQDLYADIIDFVFSYQRLWRKDMVLEMVAVPHNPWLSCRAFGDELKNRIFANIKILAYYGLVEYQKSSGDLLFRGSRENAREREGAMKNRQAADVVILPDFSAMFPQETSPEYLYWFSKVGSLDSLDKVYKGKIIKDIILDSLAAGIEGRSILAFLTLWRSSGNVIETVKEWIREFSQVCMETGAIVASADEKVTRRLYSFSPLAACLRPIQAHCIFRVVKGQEETVANLLSEMGFDHRSPMMQNSKNASENRTEPDIPVDCAAGETMLSPVFDFEKSAQAPPLLLQQGKYSGSLKALELTELMHVIDYSLLMGSRLRIEYGGSPGIRKGIYLIRPLRYQKGPDPFLEAESGRTCIKKIFLLGRILKIGVEPLYDENK